MNDQPSQQVIEPEILEALPNEMAPAVAAEISQQVATAKRYPRRLDSQIADEIKGRACLNEQIAGECMYTLKRGDKEIPGPSIRFAEIVRAAYGNIRVATRFVRIDTDDPMRAAVIVEAVAFDMQANSSEIIFERRSIMTSGKGGRKPMIYGADMTAQTAGAARSIARRNAILAVVPKAIWIEAYHRVVRTLQGDVVTLAKRRSDIIEAFGRKGIAPDKVFAAIGVKAIEDITVEHMPQLVGFMTAIAEGEHPDRVLGTAVDVGEQTPHTRVESPLQDDAPTNGKSQTPAQPAHASTAQPAQQAAATVASPQPKVEAKPATPSIEQYIEAAKAYLLKQETAADIDAWWRRERKTRIELKFNADQQADLEKAKEDRITALGG